MRPARFEEALPAWVALLGASHVILDADALRAAATATFATAQSVPAILRPANRAEVQECLRIANRYGVPVYPVSTGKNWGYGSAVPVADGCVVLDLRRLDRILDFDEKLAYVTVEPGVTQKQLFDFLQQRKSGLWMDASGASPESSLIGNAVERGFGHTPYGDHFAQVCGMEVVLPDGASMETGFAGLGGAKVAPVHRWGLGPSLDGLFSQSNFGVVTRMTFWLMPAPERFTAYFFRCDREENLPAVIEALRPLRLSEVIRSAIHIANDYKVLSALQQYPWEAQSGSVPLDRQSMRAFRRKLKFGCWNGSGGIYGTRAQTAEARRMLRRALAGSVEKLQFLDDSTLRLASAFARPYGWLTGWDLSRALTLLRPVYGLMKGVPTAQPLESTYWRKRMPVPTDMDPDRDRCGLLWCSPMAPARGDAVQEVTRLATDMLLEAGFEPMISLTLITGRAVACVVSIHYDRDLPGEDERALTCYAALLKRLIGAGYYPYRLGIQSMNAIDFPNRYRQVLANVKALLDPHHILAPGRYLPL